MVDLLTTAFDLGITHFDLANNYGPYPGSAEENFGKVLKHELAPYRDELIISTKQATVCGTDLTATAVQENTLSQVLTKV